MTSLLIPDLPESTEQALRERAARAGSSVEDVARTILSGVAAPRSFSAENARRVAAEFRDRLRALNGGKLPRGGVEALLAERRAEVAKEEAEHADRMYDHVRWGLK